MKYGKLPITSRLLASLYVQGIKVTAYIRFEKLCLKKMFILRICKKKKNRKCVAIVFDGLLHGTSSSNHLFLEACIHTDNNSHFKDISLKLTQVCINNLHKKKNHF